MDQLMAEPYIIDTMLEHGKCLLPLWRFKLSAGKRTTFSQHLWLLSCESRM